MSRIAPATPFRSEGDLARPDQANDLVDARLESRPPRAFCFYIRHLLAQPNLTADVLLQAADNFDRMREQGCAPATGTPQHYAEAAALFRAAAGFYADVPLFARRASDTVDPTASRSELG